MHLLAQLQPLYHGPLSLGVAPLPGGGKAKVQLKPKRLEKRENAQHATQWRNSHQYLQSTTPQDHRERHQNKFPWP